MRAASLLFVVSMACVPEAPPNSWADDTGSPGEGDTGDGGSADGGSADGGSGMTDVDHDGLDDAAFDLIVAHPGGKVCWNDRLAPKGTLSANMVGVTSIGVWTTPSDHPLSFEGGASDFDLWYCYVFPEGQFVVNVLSVEVVAKTGSQIPFDLAPACSDAPDPACYGEGSGALTCFAYAGGTYTWLSDTECRDVAR